MLNLGILLLISIMIILIGIWNEYILDIMIGMFFALLVICVGILTYVDINNINFK